MRIRFLLIAAAFGILASGSARAGDVVVTVAGVESPTGEIACALFSSADAFPAKFQTAALRRAPAQVGGAGCRYDGVKPGTYALAVAQLPKGQANVERDMIGRPKQPWGVSNNIRPMLRAPTFAEAAFKVAAEGETRLEVQLAK